MRIQPKALEIQIGEDLPRSKPRDGSHQNIRFLENQEVGEILLNPEMGQKVRFWNEDGHELANCLTIWHENGRSHINFFVRIQP